MIYTHIAAGLLGAALAALGVWQVQDWRFNARISAMQKAHAVSLQDEAQKALAKQQEMIDARQKLEEAYALEKRKAAVAASRARDQLAGLRQELYTLPAPSLSANPPAPSSVDDAPIERHLLGECAAALVELASEADQLATQLVGLQRYAKDVCSAPAR